MVWPSLGTRMAEGKERHIRYPCQLELWIGVNNTQDALPKLTILPVPAAVRIRLVTRNIAVLRDFEWWYIIGITVDDLQCISTHRWGLGLKVKRYRYSNKSSQSYRVSLAIWVHTMLWFVTCPRHKWTHQPDKPVLACFTYPAGVEGWVDFGDYSYIPKWFTRPHMVKHLAAVFENTYFTFFQISKKYDFLHFFEMTFQQNVKNHKKYQVCWSL